MQRRMVSGDKFRAPQRELKKDFQLSKEDEASTEEVEVCFQTSSWNDHVN